MFSIKLFQNAEPPKRIKEFAMRVNGENGRAEKLKNLPDLVESTLLVE